MDVSSGVNKVAAADDEQADEEAGEHGAGPETAAEALHVDDGGDCAAKQRAAADEGHEDGLFGVEADLIHEGRHVVHNCIDTCCKMSAQIALPSLAASPFKIVQQYR